MRKTLLLILLSLLPITSHAADLRIQNLQLGDILNGVMHSTQNSALEGKLCQVQVLSNDGTTIALRPYFDGHVDADVSAHRTVDLTSTRYDQKSKLGPSQSVGIDESCSQQTMVELRQGIFSDGISLNYISFNWCTHTYGMETYLSCKDLRPQAQ